MATMRNTGVQEKPCRQAEARWLRNALPRPADNWRINPSSIEEMTSQPRQLPLTTDRWRIATVDELNALGGPFYNYWVIRPGIVVMADGNCDATSHLRRLPGTRAKSYQQNAQAASDLEGA